MLVFSENRCVWVGRVVTICFASLCRALQGKGSPVEDVGEAAGGSDAACLQASRQAGAESDGDVVVGGQDGDNGDDDSVSSAAGFWAVLDSLLKMKEEDVFRKIVMFL